MRNRKILIRVFMGALLCTIIVVNTIYLIIHERGYRNEKYVVHNERQKINIEIQYPLLINVNEKINQQIYKEAVNTLDVTDLEKLEGYDVKGDFAITTDCGGIISICFFQQGYVINSAHPWRECKTITINTQTNKVMFREDFISDEELLKRVNNNDIVIEQAVADLDDTEVDYKSIIADYLLYDNYSLHKYYIKDNHVYIIISLSHAMGDYAVLDCGEI